jgi:hypothetical protein
MIQALATLALFIMAFFALTILGRRSWASLGQRESLVGRVAAAVVLAAIATPFATTLPFTLMDLISRSGSLGPGVEITQTEAIVGVLAGIGLTVAAVIRIEMFHRRALGLTAQSDADEWEIESSEPLTRRRTP